MATLEVFDLSKKAVSSIELSSEITDSPLREGLIKDSVIAYLAAIRQGTRATKTTSTVSGSTRKLYKQKGTGRARAGSVKGVQRRHGATQFGPQPRYFGVKENKKAHRLAFNSALAEVIRQKKLSVVSELVLAEPKSKLIKEYLLEWNAKTILFVVKDQVDDNFLLAASNFKNVKLTEVEDLNIYDMLKYKQICITKDAMEKLINRAKS